MMVMYDFFVVGTLYIPKLLPNLFNLYYDPVARNVNSPLIEISGCRMNHMDKRERETQMDNYYRTKPWAVPPSGDPGHLHGLNRYIFLYMSQLNSPLTHLKKLDKF